MWGLCMVLRWIRLIRNTAVAMLSPTNVISLNDFNQYILELTDREKDYANA